MRKKVVFSVPLSLSVSLCVCVGFNLSERVAISPLLLTSMIQGLGGFKVKRKYVLHTKVKVVQINNNDHTSIDDSKDE